MYYIRGFKSYLEFEKYLNGDHESRLHSWNLGPDGKFVAILEDAKVPPRKEPAATAKVLPIDGCMFHSSPEPGGCVSVPDKDKQFDADIDLNTAIAEVIGEPGRYHVG